MRSATLVRQRAFKGEKPGVVLPSGFWTNSNASRLSLWRIPALESPPGGDRRWFPLHGFPYSIIYRLVGTDVRILVVRHQHRDPEHGGSRR
jgi:hypothetical protein